MKKVIAFLSVGFVLLFALCSQATTLNGEYTVVQNHTNLSGNLWNFEYTITNVNQSGTWVGLDGFLVALPSSATITSVVEPKSYLPGGDWKITYPEGNIRYWGHNVQSVYPVGESAIFSFSADGVVLGDVDAVITTYWSSTNTTTYTEYETILSGPIAAPAPSPTPEPTTMVLFGLGLLGVAGVSRRKQA